MESKTLANGIKIPVLGYGVFQIDNDSCERCIIDALDAGYRLIDTAQCYFNEEGVGLGIENSSIAREDIFLTTKVWFGNYGYERTKQSVFESMKKLRTDYLDLCLLHQPYADVFGAWKALEDLYKNGYIRSIGLSNFSPGRMIDRLLHVEKRPVVNQIEIHPFWKQEESLKWMHKYNIIPEAWAPLGEGKNNLFNNKKLIEIGEQHGKSVAQIILLWHLQRGIIVIPKTVHTDRMKENIDVFDFMLTETEMEHINNLDQGKTLFNDYSDPSVVEWFASL